MQRVTGYWFREKYSARKIAAKPGRICIFPKAKVKMNIFSEFITNITCKDFDYNNRDVFEDEFDADDSDFDTEFENIIMVMPETMNILLYNWQIF